MNNLGKVKPNYCRMYYFYFSLKIKWGQFKAYEIAQQGQEGHQEMNENYTGK